MSVTDNRHDSGGCRLPPHMTDVTYDAPMKDSQKAPVDNHARTMAARAARTRNADERIARRLRDHGWLAVPPEKLSTVPSEMFDKIAGVAE